MKRRFIRGKFGVLFLLLFFLAGSVFLISFIFSFFEIKTIIVEPTNIAVSIDKHQMPTNLLLFPIDTVKSELLSEYPEISTITIIKEYPNTLHFIFMKREAIAQFVYSNKTFYVDEKHVIFSSREKYQVPIVTLQLNDMKEGTLISGLGVDCSLAFIKELRHDEAIERISLSTNDTLEVVLKDTRVLLLVTADGKERADTLQTILKGFRMKGSLPGTLDLRFSKPMILP